MKVFGDRTRFALAFELLEDLDRAGPPEEQASWACMQIWAAGRHLTAGLSESGVMVHGAEVPLAPVLRWLVGNWDALFHEERLPRISSSCSAAAWRSMSLLKLPAEDAALDALLTDREQWWQRHSLGSALPGFRIPDLHVRRLGQRVELSWTDEDWRSVPRGMQVLEASGATSLPAGEVAKVFFDFATAVVDAMATAGAVPEFAREVRSNLAHVQVPERKTIMRRLEIAAGQSLQAAASRLRRAAGVTDANIEDTLAVLLGMQKRAEPALVTPLTVPVLMYRSAGPSLSSHDLQSLLELALDRPPDVGLLGSLQCAKALPWEPRAITQQGYQLGVWLRDQLGIPAASPLVGDHDLEGALLGRLGVDLTDVQLEDEGVDGVAAKSPGSKAIIAVNRSGRFARSEVGRRMTIAHELCHLLFDIDEEGRVGVVSNAWASYAAERRANAFAAMLLMPESAMDARLQRDTKSWTVQMLHRLMRDMGVGRSALTWHLYNLDWISESEREAWADEL